MGSFERIIACKVRVIKYSLSARFVTPKRSRFRRDPVLSQSSPHTCGIRYCEPLLAHATAAYAIYVRHTCGIRYCSIHECGIRYSESLLPYATLSEIEDKDAGRGGTTTGCYIVTALIFISYSESLLPYATLNHSLNIRYTGCNPE
jgi:hypothetical protein